MSMSSHLKLGVVLTTGWLVCGDSVPAWAQKGGCLIWRERFPPPAPTKAGPITFDARRGVTVLVAQDGTWEWDGLSWTLRTNEGPQPRTDHAVAYDSARGVTVLFGGKVRTEGGDVQVGDTWEWDGRAWRKPAEDGPAPRDGHAMAFDSSRGVVVLFGGHVGEAGLSGETWEWDGITWALSSATGPAPRSGHAMAYDMARHVTVLSCGSASYPERFADTWEWSGITWTQRVESVPDLYAGSGHAMAYDSARGVSVLAAYDQTWEWDGVAWGLRAAGDTTSRSRQAMAYDNRRGVAVLVAYGTSQLQEIEAGTWEWGGEEWVLRDAGNPVRRYLHAMTYDSSRDRTILYGGRDGSYLGGTWEWDGVRWSIRSLNIPSPRWGSALAYDDWRGVAVLFGGMGPDYGSVAHCCPRDDTWESDGGGWAQRDADGPSARNSHAMAFDSRRGVMVLFGGVTGGPDDFSHLADTWEWDGTVWVRRSSVGATPRAGHAMAFDRARGVTVLFGGAISNDLGVRTYYGDTWEWDGSHWDAARTDGPEPRDGATMVYDRHRQVVVLYGGYHDEILSDMWTWDGVTWARVGQTGPGGRAYHAMAYDSAREAVVMFGGLNGRYRSNGLWESSRGSLPADSDGDCDVDLRDFGTLQRCYGSPSFQERCAFFDTDGSGLIDLADFGDFVEALTGPFDPPFSPHR